MFKNIPYHAYQHKKIESYIYFLLSGLVRCYDLTHGVMTREFRRSTGINTEISRIWPSPDGSWVACTTMASSNEIKLINLETGKWWVNDNGIRCNKESLKMN